MKCTSVSQENEEKEVVWIRYFCFHFNTSSTLLFRNKVACWMELLYYRCRSDTKKCIQCIKRKKKGVDLKFHPAAPILSVLLKNVFHFFWFNWIRRLEMGWRALLTAICHIYPFPFLGTFRSNRQKKTIHSNQNPDEREMREKKMELGRYPITVWHEL